MERRIRFLFSTPVAMTNGRMLFLSVSRGLTAMKRTDSRTLVGMGWFWLSCKGVTFLFDSIFHDATVDTVRFSAIEKRAVPSGAKVSVH